MTFNWVMSTASSKTLKRRILRIKARIAKREQFHQCSYCSRFYDELEKETKTFQKKKCCSWCWAKLTGDRRIHCLCNSLYWPVCSEHPCTCGKGSFPRPYHEEKCVHHLPRTERFPEKTYCAHCDIWTTSKEQSERHYDCGLNNTKFCEKCEKILGRCRC